MWDLDAEEDGSDETQGSDDHKDDNMLITGPRERVMRPGEVQKSVEGKRSQNEE